MNKAEIISRHAQALKGQVGTSLAIDECEDIMASMFYESINFIPSCCKLKDKKLKDLINLAKSELSNYNKQKVLKTETIEEKNRKKLLKKIVELNTL